MYIIFFDILFRVVQEVRSHFGCPTLEGAELEDQVKRETMKPLNCFEKGE